MRSLVKLHPLAAFYILAYACSWLISIPLALQAQAIWATRLPFALHYLSGLGPAIAALLITLFLRLDRRRNCTEQPSSFQYSARWLLVGAFSPLLLFAAAQVFAGIASQTAPSWMALGQVNFLPDLGLWAWVLWFFSNGWGEELGWRGFALPHLQRTHSALASSLLLSFAWAGWHLPAFFYVPSYAALGLRVLPGFFLGIVAGAIVLTWLYNSSHGSVLAAVLWHASFNFVSASPAVSGFAAAVTSTLVVVWAVAILWRYPTKTLAAAPKHMTPILSHRRIEQLSRWTYR